METEFDSTEAFYADDETRRHSGEADYGVNWMGPDQAGWPRWRVSYVQATGEVYAREHSTDHIVLLGKCPPDEDGPASSGRNYYDTLDGLLAGWPAASHQSTYLWVKSRLPEQAG